MPKKRKLDLSKLLTRLGLMLIFLAILNLIVLFFSRIILPRKMIYFIFLAGISIFVIGVIIYILLNFKKVIKNKWTYIIFFILVVIFIIFATNFFNLAGPRLDVCSPVVTPPNFFINTSTKKCDFFPGSGCINKDTLKGYGEECNPSLEEKVDILKNRNYWYENISWFDKITGNCSKYCEETGNGFFCYSENNSKNLCKELEVYR